MFSSNREEEEGINQRNINICKSLQLDKSRQKHLPTAGFVEICSLSFILDGTLVTTVLACRNESLDGVQTR